MATGPDLNALSRVCIAYGLGPLPEPSPRRPESPVNPNDVLRRIRALDPGNYLWGILDPFAPDSRIKVMGLVRTHLGGDFEGAIQNPRPDAIDLEQLFQEIRDRALQRIWSHILRILRDFGDLLDQYPGELAEAEIIRNWMRDPANAQYLARIEQLGLSRLELTCIPDEIKYLPGLKILDLSRNRIRAVNKIALEGLRHLERVNFTENVIFYLPEDLFENNRHIERVSFSYNKIYSIAEHALRGCANLTLIFFEGNEIRNIPEDLFADCTALSDAYFKKNKITAVPSGLFRNCSKMTAMEFAHNRLTQYPKFANQRWPSPVEVENNPFSCGGTLVCLVQSVVMVWEECTSCCRPPPIQEEEGH